MQELVNACPEQTELITKILQKITNQKASAEVKKEAGSNAASAHVPAVERTQGWCTITGQSFQVPRGNLDVEFHMDGSIGLHSKSVDLLIPPEGIEFAYELPSPNANVGSSIILHLYEEVQVGKSTTKTLLLTPKTSPKSKLLRVEIHATPPGNSALADYIEDEPVYVWRTLLEAMEPSIILREPDPSVFRSNQNTSSLKCYHNVKDGVLYPLPDGIAFIRSPTLFLTLPEISQVALQRELSGGTRNFDLNIIMNDGTFHEIRMIEKDEFDAITAYVEETKINENHLKTEAGEDGNIDRDGEGGAGSEDEDSDFKDSDDEEESGEGVHGAKIKKEAGQGDDEDEKEDDDDDDDDDDGDSSDGEDHESDIDSSDIELDKEIELDESDTIALNRPKRKAALAAFPSSQRGNTSDKRSKST